jgi:hypothetical protein
MSKALPKGGSALCCVQGYERPALGRAAPSLNGADMKPTEFKNRHQFTGNAGLSYAAWQLSRRGWHVVPTIRNARGSDMLVTDADEIVKFGVQSKALSKRQAVPLGRSIENLRSEWWVITIHANSDQPVCFVMRKEEVEANASQDKNGGAFWLEPRDYDRDEYRNAWDRIGMAPTI